MQRAALPVSFVKRAHTARFLLGRSAGTIAQLALETPQRLPWVVRLSSSVRPAWRVPLACGPRLEPRVYARACVRWDRRVRVGCARCVRPARTSRRPAWGRAFPAALDSWARPSARRASQTVWRAHLRAIQSTPSPPIAFLARLASPALVSRMQVRRTVHPCPPA